MLVLCSDRIAVAPLDGGALLIEHDSYEVIEGDGASRILAAVHAGATSREALVSALGPAYTHESVGQLVDLMLQDELLYELPPTVSADICARWQKTGYPLRDIHATLLEVGVNLQGKAGAALASVLKNWGIATTGQALALVEAPHLFDPALLAHNDALWKAEQPWMLVARDTQQHVLFVPEETGCLRCLQAALLHNQPALMDLGTGSRQQVRSKPESLASQLFYERVARVVFDWLMDGAQAGHLWNQSSIYEPATAHSFTSRHTCPTCGCAQAESASKPTLAAHLAHAMAQQGRRSNATIGVQPYEPLIDAVTGVLRRPCVLPPLDRRAGYTAVVQHNMVQPAVQIDNLRINTQGRSIGKGETPAAARASAIFEGLERFSGIWRPGIPLEFGAPHDMQHALDGRSLAGYSCAQNEARTRWNQQQELPILRIPEPYAPNKGIGWVTGYSLVHRRDVMVPAAYCFYDYPSHDGFLCDSNGCAAGAGYSDALLAALCELIERDAVSMWWYNRARRPGLRLEGIDDAYIQNQLAVQAALGRSLHVLDLTTDLGVPVVVALSLHTQNEADIVMGFGCHWDMARAINGALLELNQVQTIRAVSAHPAPLFDGVVSTHEAWLHPAGEAVAWEASEAWPALEVLVARLAAKGFDVVVVDQTHPDIGLPVLRAIVPRLCHHWRRLGITRLYDAPVAMGWRNESLTEATINPVNLLL